MSAARAKTSPKRRRAVKRARYAVKLDEGTARLLRAHTLAFASAVAALDALRDELLVMGARCLARLEKASLTSSRGASRRGPRAGA